MSGESDYPHRDTISFHHYSLDALLTPTLKSYGFSLLLHASVVAALYAIPTSSSQRFTQTGQKQVISIEATQDRPVSTSVSYFEPQEVPLTSELDSPIDRLVSIEPLEMREVPDERTESRLGDAATPRLAVPVSVPNEPLDQQLMMKRREANEVPPEVMVVDTPPKPEREPVMAEPPGATAIPIEQFVGLEGESSADLSNNRPPVYPLEAVHQRLEGVVLLQLTIAKDGKVESVELIKSSGHQVLDRAAINAVATWQGKPAKRWGRPVESIERLPVRFRL